MSQGSKQVVEVLGKSQQILKEKVVELQLKINISSTRADKVVEFTFNNSRTYRETVVEVKVKNVLEKVLEIVAKNLVEILGGQSSSNQEGSRKFRYKF